MRAIARGKTVEVREVRIDITDWSGNTFYMEDHVFIDSVDVMSKGYFYDCKTREKMLKLAIDFIEAGVL